MKEKQKARQSKPVGFISTSQPWADFSSKYTTQLFWLILSGIFHTVLTEPQLIFAFSDKEIRKDAHPWQMQKKSPNILDTEAVKHYAAYAMEAAKLSP